MRKLRCFCPAVTIQEESLVFRFARYLPYLLMIVLTISGCASDQKTDRQAAPNTVVMFFQNAERQTESADDRLKVRQALNDMLTLAPDSLRARRYADYQGKAGAWTITTLLAKHFMPDHPMELDTSTFYTDYVSADARKLIEQHVGNLEAAIKNDSL